MPLDSELGPISYLLEPLGFSIRAFSGFGSWEGAKVWLLVGAGTMVGAWLAAFDGRWCPTAALAFWASRSRCLEKQGEGEEQGEREMYIYIYI